MQPTAHRWLLGLVFVAGACTSSSDPAPVIQADGSWRVRCPAPAEACDYPARTITGSISIDDLDRSASCDVDGTGVHVNIGKPSYTDPQGTRPGFNIGMTLGFAAGTGFDLARQCALMVSEEDGRGWGASCSEAGPPATPCQLTSPMLQNGVFSATLRCEAMHSIPFQAGRDADLAAANDPAAPFTIQISPCNGAP
jgi:hypothetical protein